MPSVLVTAPLRQEPKIFKEYRESIANLSVPDGFTVDTFFVVNNCDEIIPCLYSSDKYIIHNTGESYSKTHNNHVWFLSNMSAMETLRNLTIQYALDHNYDFWFSVDTDLVLHPLTLQTLLEADKELIHDDGVRFPDTHRRHDC